jgi:hypothetical protein
LSNGLLALPFILLQRSSRPQGVDRDQRVDGTFTGAFLIGAGCRFFDVPIPGPQKLVGALLGAYANLCLSEVEIGIVRPGPVVHSVASPRPKKPGTPRQKKPKGK